MPTTHIKRRTVWLAAALGVCLVATAMWFYGYLADSQAMAQSAAEDTAECARLAAEIRELRQQPSLAHSREMQHRELTQHIEQAAQAAGIPAGNLTRISPEPAKAVGETAYMRKATDVVFHGVTMPQIVNFLEQISAEEAGPQVTRLRLAAPGAAETEEQWSAEMTLTYLIYSPKPVKPHSAAAKESR